MPSFQYDSIAFGPVTDCDGVLFHYIASAQGLTLCDTLIGMDTAIVVVYPDFTANIEQICDTLNPDSVYLNVQLAGHGAQCDYRFNWSNGDTARQIQVLLTAGTTYCVTVSRTGLSTACVRSDCYTLQAATSLDCSALRDTLLSCSDLIPAADTSLVIVNGCGGESYCINVEETDNDDDPEYFK